MNENNQKKLTKILIEVFRLEKVSLLSEIELIDEDLKWDSLNILSLIAQCEDKFSIIIKIEDYEKIISIKSLKQILNKFNI